MWERPKLAITADGLGQRVEPDKQTHDGDKMSLETATTVPMVRRVSSGRRRMKYTEVPIQRRRCRGSQLRSLFGTGISPTETRRAYNTFQVENGMIVANSVNSANPLL
jgi:hypothetical protein